MKGDAIWISPEGKEIGPVFNHWTYVIKNPNKFSLGPSLVDQIENKRAEKDYETTGFLENIVFDLNIDKFLYKNGWVRTRRTGLSVSVEGIRDEVKDKLDSIIVDRKGVEYYVDVIDLDTNEKENYYSLSLAEFMNKFSGRKSKRRKSKIQRFREIVRKEIKNIVN